jgi:predicted membrane metal-binding protein
VTSLVALAAAAVLGTLAVAPLSPSGRALDACGTVVLCAYAAFREARLVRPFVPATLALFAANTWWHIQHVPVVREMRTARYHALALSPLGESGTTSTFAAILDGGLRVLVHARGAPPSPGAYVLLRGRLEPFDEARNPAEPSEAAIESERGFDAQVSSGDLLAVSPVAQWDSRAWLARAHAWALARLRDGLGEPAASIVAGELWGERAALPPDLRTEFQETGTVHVLVTAG